MALAHEINEAIFSQHKHLSSIKIRDIGKNMIDFRATEMAAFSTPIVVREIMVDIFGKLVDKVSASIILKGASGIGKTSTLVAVGHVAREAGALVLPIQARDFVGAESQRVGARFIRRWVKASGEALLQSVTCPLNEDKTFLELANAASSQNGLTVLCEIISNLLEVDQIPVVLLVDAANAFYETDMGKVIENPLARLLCDMSCFRASRGCILFAYSASFVVPTSFKDGDYACVFQVMPMSKEEFSTLISVLAENGAFPAFEVEVDQLYALCRGLPRELKWFARVSKNAGTFEQALEIYYEERVPHFEQRLEALLASEQQRETVDTFYAFPNKAEVFSFPKSWIDGGLVSRFEGRIQLSCKAMESAVSTITSRKAMRSFTRRNIALGDGVVSAIKTMRRLYVIGHGWGFVLRWTIIVVICIAVQHNIPITFVVLSLKRWFTKILGHKMGSKGKWNLNDTCNLQS